VVDVEETRKKLVGIGDDLEAAAGALDTIAGSLASGGETPRRTVPLVWQSDLRWRFKLYSDEAHWTFGRGGCLVCSVYALARWAGCKMTLLKFASGLREAGVFEGAELKHHARVKYVCPRLHWRMDHWIRGTCSSMVIWRNKPAHLTPLLWALARYPVVVQVDFKPATKALDRHFVLANEYIPAPEDQPIEDNLLVMDPWTGTYTSVLTYFEPGWLRDGTMAEGVTKVQRTLYGARIWEVR